MKKFWTLLLVAPIALALNACGPQDDASTTDTVEQVKEDVVNTANDAAAATKEAAADATAKVEEAVDAAKEKAEEAKEAVQDKIDETKADANDAVVEETTTEEVVEEAPATDAEFDNTTAPATAE